MTLDILREICIICVYLLLHLFPGNYMLYLIPIFINLYINLPSFFICKIHYLTSSFLSNGANGI